MLGRNIGLTVSCALGASAFLLPPGGLSDDKDLLPFVAVDPKHQLLELPCTGCNFPKLNAEGIQDDVATNLLLDFSISEDGQALLLNKKQVFPLDQARQNIIDGDWSVEAVPATVSRKQLEGGDFEGTPLLITGHDYSASPLDMLTPEGDGIITVSWTPVALEYELLALDEVAIQLLRTSEGELLILSADAITTPEDIFTIKPIMPIKPFGPPKQPTKECKYLPGPLCDMSNFVGSKLNGLKHGRPGCGGANKFDSFEGRLPTHIKPHFGPMPTDLDEQAFPSARPDGEKPEHRGHPHGPHGSHGPHGPHGPHGHQHHRHGFFHAFARGVDTILVPVLLGVGVGLMVACLGLVTGHFIGWLWFTVIRGGKRGYASVALTDSSDMVKGVDTVEQHIEPLPRYEDAPAYEETEKEVV